MSLLNLRQRCLCELGSERLIEELGEYVAGDPLLGRSAFELRNARARRQPFPCLIAKEHCEDDPRIECEGIVGRVRPDAPLRGGRVLQLTRQESLDTGTLLDSIESRHKGRSSAIKQ